MKKYLLFWIPVIGLFYIDEVVKWSNGMFPTTKQNVLIGLGIYTHAVSIGSILIILGVLTLKLI